MFNKRTIIAALLGWGVIGFFFSPRDLLGMFKSRGAS